MKCPVIKNNLWNYWQINCDYERCPLILPENAININCPKILISGKSCKIECNYGFKLSNENGIVYCKSGILYKPSCIPDSCSIDLPIKNALTTNCKQKLQSGDKCTISCEPNFKPSNETGEITCENGKIQMATCIPENSKNICEFNHPPNSTTINCKKTLNFGESCNISCNPGYTPSDDLGIVKCTKNGELIYPSCNPNSCKFQPPIYGKTDCGNLIESGKSCKIQCDEGYESSSGFYTITCKNGSFNDIRCVKIKEKSCNIPNIYNGIFDTCQKTLKSGETCLIKCEKNTKPSNGNGIVKCNNGILQIPSCEKEPINKSCNFMKPPNVSDTNCSSILNNKESCVIKCETGFLPSEIYGYVKCNDGIIKYPSCLPKTCKFIPPENMIQSNCNDDIMNYGEKCTIKCKNGYTPENTSGTISCGLDGLITTSCVENSCSFKSKNVKDTTCPEEIKSGGKCYISCAVGYEPSSNGGFVTCDKGNITESSCIKKPYIGCSITIPENANTITCEDKLDNGKSCTIKCKKGYTASAEQMSSLTLMQKFGEEEIQLKCNGGNIIYPTCRPMSCKFEKPDNMFRTSCDSIINSGSSCNLDCDTGYEPINKYNDNKIRCNLGEIDVPDCIPKSCNFRLPDNSTNEDCNETLKSGDKCTIKCNHGYDPIKNKKPSPNSEIECNFGVLTSLSCERKKCSYNGWWSPYENKCMCLPNFHGPDCSTEMRWGVESIKTPHNSETFGIAEKCVLSTTGTFNDEKSCIDNQNGNWEPYWCKCPKKWKTSENLLFDTISGNCGHYDLTPNGNVFNPLCSLTGNGYPMPGNLPACWCPLGTFQYSIDSKTSICVSVWNYEGLKTVLQNVTPAVSFCFLYSDNTSSDMPICHNSGLGEYCKCNHSQIEPNGGVCAGICNEDTNRCELGVPGLCDGGDLLCKKNIHLNSYCLSNKLMPTCSINPSPPQGASIMPVECKCTYGSNYTQGVLNNNTSESKSKCSCPTNYKPDISNPNNCINPDNKRICSLKPLKNELSLINGDLKTNYPPCYCPAGTIPAYNGNSDMCQHIYDSETVCSLSSESNELIPLCPHTGLSELCVGGWKFANSALCPGERGDTYCQQQTNNQTSVCDFSQGYCKGTQIKCSCNNVYHGKNITLLPKKVIYNCELGDITCSQDYMKHNPSTNQIVKRCVGDDHDKSCEHNTNVKCDCYPKKNLISIDF